MRGAAARLAALGLVAVTAALCAASCAVVIGVEAPEDVVKELCECGGGQDLDFDCGKEISRALNEDKEGAKDWLKDYEKNCACGDLDPKKCLNHPVFCHCGEGLGRDALGQVACDYICGE